MASVQIHLCLWGVNMFKTKYRIVTDKYIGYEAQFKRWYWPFYMQIDRVNSHLTIEAAERMIESHKFKSEIVKYVD